MLWAVLPPYLVCKSKNMYDTWMEVDQKEPVKIAQRWGDLRALYFKIGIGFYKECFYNKSPGLCIKEKTLTALNESIMDERPIYFGLFEIKKNPDYFLNQTTDLDTGEGIARSEKLSDALMQKFEQFLKSRSIKLNLSNAFEGRKGGGGGGGGGGKKGGGGGGGGSLIILAICGMGAMMVNMVMGKMAMMAGSALMIAKVSLLLSLIMLVKKMQEKGGGGEEKHIVYADAGHSHGGGGYGGGGGWHRSLDDAQNIVYKGQWTASTDNGSGL
ncbi:uncharacterized protein LOC130444691 [Diorhabda sublineata]|uniref:uncharacterized protein LOC130444691 n=1 Tax=Diorhabda sublineata TaxID=1163346 RepID=UPI0024E097B0|nr:uncharacterized protein LOC130444691 [Diorhabda sublineata]